MGKKFVSCLIVSFLLYPSCMSQLLAVDLWETRRAAAEAAKSKALEQREFTQMASLPSNFKDVPSSYDSILPEGRATNIVSGNLQSQATARAKSAPADSLSGILPAPLRGLPYSCGEIVKVNLSKDADAPFVFLIQDASKTNEAQRSIVGALSHIQAEMNGSSLLIGVEGSKGAFDTNQYRAQKSARAQREVWETLMNKSLISGAEYFSLTADKAPLLWGVEDESLYLNSIAADLHGSQAKEEALAWIGRMNADLNDVKSRIFDQDVRRFDELSRKFEQRQIGLTEYLKYFNGSIEINSGKYPEIEKYFALLQIEMDLDFKKVGESRGRLIKTLASKLKPGELQWLLEMSVAYRLGRVSYSQYYAFLKNLMSTAGVQINQYPDFYDYIYYVFMAEKINLPELSVNIIALKNATIERLSQTPGQREAFALSEALEKVEKLMNRELTPDEWAAYNRSQEKMHQLPVSILLLKERVDTQFDSIAKLVVTQPVKNFSRAVMAVSPAPKNQPRDKDLNAYSRLLTTFESFYNASERRNKALADNFLSKVRETEAPEIAVLIAGGFHTPALSEALESRNISYAIFRPPPQQSIVFPSGDALISLDSPPKNLSDLEGSEICGKK